MVPEETSCATEGNTPIEQAARPKRRGRKHAEVANDDNDVFAREGAQAAAEQAVDHQGQPPAPLVEAPSVSGGPAPQAGKKRQGVEHSKLSVPAGDMTVHLIDRGDNRAGIGIKITFPEGARGRPTAEEKEVIRQAVKGGPGQDSGFTWKGRFGMWHRDVVRDGERPEEVPSSRPVAIRLDAESRVHKLAEALAQHAADPAGHAERIKQQREQVGQEPTVA